MHPRVQATLAVAALMGAAPTPAPVPTVRKDPFEGVRRVRRYGKHKPSQHLDRSNIADQERRMAKAKEKRMRRAIRAGHTIVGPPAEVEGPVEKVPFKPEFI